MRARALVLTETSRQDFHRWSLAAAIVTAVHVGLAGTYLLLPNAPPQGAPIAPAVIFDLAPLPVAPSSPQDLAPGPQTPNSVESIPEPVPPLQPAEPVISAPKVEAPAEVVLPEPQPKPVDEKPVIQPETKPVEKKPVERKPEPQKIERRPASRATAAPRSEHRPAERAAAPSPGSEANRAAIASWRSQVYARLQSAKRCPSGASGTGSVTVSFAVDRGGGVIGRNIMRGSGNSAFDQEALAMVARAAPFPPVPAAQPTPVRMPVPVNFSCR